MFKVGDKVQVRDRRDMALAIPKAVIVEPLDCDDTYTVQDEDDPKFKCRVPAKCVERRLVPPEARPERTRGL